MGDDRRKRQGPKVYEETQQVRIRKKNPLIERKPSERDDSGATVASTEIPRAKQGEPVVLAQMSADGMSLYEQIEHTDRIDEVEVAARELLRATEAPARAPMLLEDTKSMIMEPRQRPEREPPPPKKKPKPPARRKPKQEDAPTDPVPKKAASFMDEEETLVASGPPQRVGELEKVHAYDRFSESDEHVPTLIPAVQAERAASESERRREGRASPGPGPAVQETPPPAAVVVRRNVPKQKAEEEPLLDVGVVPKRYLGAPGTHGAGAEVHRQLVDRIDRELPEVHAAPLKILRGELSGDLLEVLEEILAGRHDQRSTDGSISPKRSLEHLINEKSYNALAPKDRAKLLMPIAEDPRDLSTIKSGIAIVKTRVLERLPDHLRAKLLDLFSTLDPDARATLAQLAARQLRGRSLLEDRDLRDVPLIDRLTTLVYGDPIPEILETHGVRRERIVKLVLAAVASPAKLSFEEGSPGVISAIEFALADASPAEYARLWSEIVSKTCAAELFGGGRLELTGRVDEQVSFTNQVTPLRIGLDQLPELAHPRSKRAERDFIMPGGFGIDADVVSRALTLVYGVGYTVAAGSDTALRHLERATRDPHRSPPVFVSLLYERGERLFLFDHFDQDTVFLRAPHGRSTKRAGAFRSDPARAVVDPDAGLESVSLRDFREGVGVGLIPRG